MLIKVPVQTAAKYFCSGTSFGPYQYLTKYVTSHGGHAEIAFLLRKILCDVGWLRTKSVMNAGRMRSQRVTCSGHAQKLEKCGLALR